MQFRRLTILMWKHVMVRMRRFIHTPIEFLSPIVFILILYCFKDKINALRPGVEQDSYQIRYTDTVGFNQLSSLGRVLYTPDVNLTNKLMDAVGKRLNIKRFDPIDFEDATKGYCAFGNFSELIGWLDKLKNKDAIIQFHDLEDRAEWPEHLSYTIRMRGAFFTREIESRDGVAKPHREFGRDYYQFVGLQWALDTSFIEMLARSENPENNITLLPLSIQEFPAVGHSVQNEQMAMIGALLEVLTYMSLFLAFVFLMSRLMEERVTGIQELVKMVGVSSNLFGIAHFINVLPVGLVYSIGSTCLLKCSSNPLIYHSDGLIIFIMLALHFVSVIAMAFACSYISQSNQYTVTLSVFVYILLCAPARYMSSYPNMQGFALFACLLPHVPVQWLWNEITAREVYGEGITFADVFSSHSGPSGPIALGALGLIVQSLIIFALAWYLALVRPGQYGQALPWNFLVQKQYWSKNEVKPESDVEEEVPIVREAKYFEELPKNLEVGIKIENVTKVFPKHTALNNVSLDVFKGEITVLLGHNGAGKTTLMSIITGMTSATEGRVIVNGIDSTQSSDEVRMHLGLCPQHNLFFSDITVLEHVMFFTLLKGGSFKNSREASYELLEKLGLREKASVHSSALSGGMKRRLQLACALAGGADVLVLDEPTSGLDVETRRELWDLLLSLRGERTVLLTTHFMEEADALGDRVAALHLGRLRCYATTMYLKKAIGTGYRLTFTTSGLPREAAITAAVTSHVPDATLKEQSLNSLSYNLPASASGTFPVMFSALEDRKSELSIETIGVGVSTLEEVFLKLCSDTDTTFAENGVDVAAERTHKKVTGIMLCYRQFWILLRRQVKYALYRKIPFLVLQIIIPIVFICMFTKMSNNDQVTPTNEKVLLDLNLYSPLPERRVLCDVTSDVHLRALNDAYPKSTFIEVNNVTEMVLRASQEDATDYKKFIVGIEIDDKHVKALFTTTVRHAAPVSVNVLSNALATRYLKSHADGRTIRAYFDPIPPQGPIRLDLKLTEPKQMGQTILYSLLIVFIILSTNINAVSLACKERVTGARHIHMMSGCSATLHWSVTCFFHAACCGVFLVTTVVAAALSLDRDSTINSPRVAFTFMLVLMVGSLAFFALMYFLSFFFQERVASIVLIAMLIIFCLITTSIKITSDIFIQEDEDLSIWDMLLSLCSYTMPPHSATIAFLKVANSARLNAYCELNRDKCPNLFVAEFSLADMEKCCAATNPYCYLCVGKYAPGKELIILTVQFFVYMGLVIVTQNGVFNRLHDLIFNMKYRNSAHTAGNLDEIVRAEAIYVDKQIALPKKKIDESGVAMLVNDLHKNYHRLIGKSCNAVQGISFSVKKGECFGLLGVNGAGKSSTFKMLTAEECPTKGQIYGNGFFRHEGQPYLQTLGYCPQFFGLDEFQTGRENLELVMTLRGLDATDVDREVKSWIQVVGLEAYSDRVVAGYSGGCTRRLAAAAALGSGAPLTLLDEPTAGVDVSARRRVWRALQRGLAQGRAVIITSHSMDEMEALCSRIAIMSAGVIRAVGTPSELRARHAAGHAVLIKMAHAPQHDGDEVDSAKAELQRLKSNLQSTFNCTLKDEHKTMLHYHINETMRYSNLFSALEELKAAHPSLVEDYSVTETTLEEVFLSFAREQRVATEPKRNHMV